jgi:hypothetical protein
LQYIFDRLINRSIAGFDRLINRSIAVHIRSANKSINAVSINCSFRTGNKSINCGADRLINQSISVFNQQINRSILSCNQLINQSFAVFDQLIINRSIRPTYESTSWFRAWNFIHAKPTVHMFHAINTDSKICLDSHRDEKGPIPRNFFTRIQPNY